LGHSVDASGPRPYYVKDRSFKPSFWIEGRDLPSDKYEPLVLSWKSHHTTVLEPDPGFLMTYGLVPRTGNREIVYWHDPEVPRYGIVTVVPRSVWYFPLGTRAYVLIRKAYLQDYLTLRNMALVQVYWEIRWGSIDADMRARLGGLEGINIDFADRRFQIGRGLEQGSVYAQVWGARLVASPSTLPISADPLDEEGLIWPGVDSPVTNDVARGLGVLDFVYVDDAVLAEYEGKPGFKIYPESGSVGHGTQWSVSFCSRVGRNHIRLETKKLYEGAPPDIIRHWNSFAAEAPPKSSYPAILDEPNIAIRAKRLTFAVAGLGEALSALAKSVGLIETSPEHFVSLRRRTLEYHGWWNFPLTEAISRHVPLGLPADAFLERCLSLNKLVVEGLSERNLRKTLLLMELPSKGIAKFRTLKLLDCVVRLAQCANATGLSLCNNGALLWTRLVDEGTDPAQPIAHLFALHDLRTLQAHKAGDRDSRLREELERFDVSPGDGAAGYGHILDRIYDSLATEILDAAKKIKISSEVQPAGQGV
jgi:hypothetical protein